MKLFDTILQGIIGSLFIINSVDATAQDLGIGIESNVNRLHSASDLNKAAASMIQQHLVLSDEAKPSAFIKGSMAPNLETNLRSRIAEPSMLSGNTSSPESASNMIWSDNRGTWKLQNSSFKPCSINSLELASSDPCL
jgi:hypothetical protein